MKKKFIQGSVAALGLAGIFGLVSCGGSDTPTKPSNDASNSTNNSSNNGGFAEFDDPFVMASQEVDKVFNPFFSSSVADSSVVGMTQMGMLGNDGEGQPKTAKDGESVVVYDYEIVSNDDDTTTYNLVLRNDIKFANGTSLSIKDVLFNLYVYLDPVYTGSATLYSTDIVGLKKYRTQEESEEEQENYKKKFEKIAKNRVSTLASVADQILNEDHKDTDFYGDVAKFREVLASYVEEGTANANLVEDFDQALKLFKEEIDTDYKNSKDSYSELELYDKNGKSYKPFKSDVEVFLYNEGFITWNSDFDNEGNGRLEYSINEDDIKNYTEESAKQMVIDSKMPTNVVEVITLWQTASELQDYIVNMEMEKSYAGSDLKFKNIEGIKFANKENDVTVNNVTYKAPTYKSNGDVESGNEVLSITINGVDPKAIWNFAFTVAPMYYYSNEEQINLFDYDSHFGIEYGSTTFRDNVLKNQDKLSLPMGAGAYQIANSDGSTTNVTANSFFDGTTLHFARNEYFRDAKTGNKASLKNVFFRVTPSNNLVNSLTTKEVDYCEPNAKPELIAELQNLSSNGIKYKEVSTSGYGYIGINAGKVKNLYVRQAIMHAISPDDISRYYGSSAETIYRSMSKNSWAYPKNSTPYYPCLTDKIPQDLDKVSPIYKDYMEEHHADKIGNGTLTEEEQVAFIKYLVTDLGCIEDVNGKYPELNYILTIAGASDDHPAYNAMLHASQLLNKAGFSTTVFKDANALSKLNNGELAIWAAAWSSTIDPDMYQVYHKESNASAVKNWGYPEILRNSGGAYDTENEILDELCDKIEAARKTNDQKERARIYSDALDLVMQLAIELPTYQRTDLSAYNASKVNENSFVQNPTAYKGLTSNLWRVTLNS